MESGRVGLAQQCMKYLDATEVKERSKLNVSRVSPQGHEQEGSVSGISIDFVEINPS